MNITPEQIRDILEAALMVAGRTLTIADLQRLFPDLEQPSAADVKAHLTELKERYKTGGIQLQEVSSGYRLQAKAELSPWLSKLWEERAPRYSRAFLETLAIIAYKQPITRAEIEEIRGVTVSTNIVKTLQEREWIRVIGHRDVPGKPAIYGTTKTFLDHFNLKSLTEMPTLAEFKDFEAQESQLQVQLAMEKSDIGPNDSEYIPEERDAIIHDETIEPESNVIAFEQAANVLDETENTEEVMVDENEQEEALA